MGKNLSLLHVTENKMKLDMVIWVILVNSHLIVTSEIFQAVLICPFRQICGPSVLAVLRPKYQKVPKPTYKYRGYPISSFSLSSIQNTHPNPSPIFSSKSLSLSMEESRSETFPIGRSDKRSPQPDSRDFSYRGVRRRSWGRYVSEIRIPGTKTRIWLGSFVSAEMAARAYDAAAFFLRGNSATLNFPELASLLPRPDSASRRDIQRAAAKAAATESFARHVSERDEAGTDFSVCTSGAFWELDEDIFRFFEDVKEAPLHSPQRIEADFGFDFGNNDCLGNDNAALDSWWDDGGCNGLTTWNRFV